MTHPSPLLFIHPLSLSLSHSFLAAIVGVSTDTVVDLPTTTDICITIADQPRTPNSHHCSKADADVLYLIPYYTFYLASVLCHHRRRCCYINTNNNCFIKKFSELWCTILIYIFSAILHCMYVCMHIL